MRSRSTTLRPAAIAVTVAAAIGGCATPDDNPPPAAETGQIPQPAPAHEAPPRPAITWAPRTYVAQRATGRLQVDGRLSEPSWTSAPWTEDFVDIEGSSRPAPQLGTRAKVLWDDAALWIGAELEDPHVWGTLTERDAVIYMDDDFELFLDPDGDTHAYYELEINALGTEWDLLLVRPYRDGGPAIHAWDIPGLRTAVHVDGTVNDPGDRDTGWSVEIAIPWTALAEATDVQIPPRPGDRWRLNFSRVDWPVQIRDGRTVKRVDPQTGEDEPERNWVWSPQGLVAMHYPEMWGFLQFSDSVGPEDGRDLEARTASRTTSEAERAGWFLREVYYAQHEYRALNGRWADDPSDLDPASGLERDPARTAPAGEFSLGGLAVTPNGFEAWVPLADGGSVRIDHEGRVRVSR